VSARKRKSAPLRKAAEHAAAVAHFEEGVYSDREIARLVGVSPDTAARWHRAWNRQNRRSRRHTGRRDADAFPTPAGLLWLLLHPAQSSPRPAEQPGATGDDGGTLVSLPCGHPTLRPFPGEKVRCTVCGAST
jgi:hypothetical protein